MMTLMRKWSLIMSSMAVLTVICDFLMPSTEVKLKMKKVASLVLHVNINSC